MIHSLRASPISNRFQLLNFEEELGDDMQFVRKDCCDLCEKADSLKGCRMMIVRCCPPGMTFETSSCESCYPCIDFERKGFIPGDRTLGQRPPVRIDTFRQSRRARAQKRDHNGGSRR